jgi:hypothetical protein
LYRNTSVTGVFEEGCGTGYWQRNIWGYKPTGPGPGTDMDELKTYVMSSMLWDPSQDPQTVVGEFLVGFFSAEAAPYVHQYLDYMGDAAANATPQIHPSTNRPQDWHSNGPAFLTFASLLRGNEAFCMAENATKLPIHRKRLRKASMAVLLPALWRWDELRAYAVNASIAWPLPSTKDAALRRFEAIYNETGTAGLVNVNFSPCGLPNWKTDCVFECSLQWLRECIFASAPAGCPATGHPGRTALKHDDDVATTAVSDEVIWQDFRKRKGSDRQNNWTDAEQTLVLALQGLANRERPRLFLNVSEENMSYNHSATAWATWIAQHKRLVFQPQYSSDLCQLVGQLAGNGSSSDADGGTVRGLVLYDDLLHRHLPPHAGSCQLVMRTLATTIAGLDSLLPVTPTMLADHASCLGHRDVVRNLTDELERAEVFGSVDCDLAGNQWGMHTLLPQTNATAVFAVSGNAPWVWLAGDYAVQQRMYCFALEPNASANPAQATLFTRILRTRRTPAAVFGWPSVHEGAGTTATSKAGCYVMCAAGVPLFELVHLPASLNWFLLVVVYLRP